VQRSIRRAQQRRLENEQRRAALKRRRAGIAAGAAIGATALFAPAAQAATFHVTGTTDGAVAACVADNCAKLRDAVAAANTAAGDDKIDFQAGLTGTIRLTQGELPIAPVTTTDGLAISGPGASTLSVSGDKDNSGTPDAGDSRVFHVSGTGPVSIAGLTLTHGYAPPGAGATDGAGGAILVDANSSLTVTDSAITSSTAPSTGGGGGILGLGSLSLTRTTISGNTATLGPGGGVQYGNSGGTGTFTIANSQITGNTAVGGGGVTFAHNTTVTDSTISGNTATGTASGGGIAGEGGLALTRTDVTGNTAAGGSGGGVLYFAGGNAGLVVTGGTINGNSAGVGGGLSTGGHTRLEGATVSGNHATTAAAGGIEAGGRTTLNASTVSGNTAVSDGGGIEFDGKYGGIRTNSSTISGNTSGAGGGIGIESSKYGASSTLTDTNVTGNHSTGGGAGVFVRTLGEDDRFTAVRTTISGNVGEGGAFGGGVGFAGGTDGAVKGEFTLLESTISGNTAGTGGGVSAGTPAEAQLIGAGGSIDFQNSTIAANSATNKGGGIYLGQYDSGSPAAKKSAVIKLTSAIVADNTVGVAPQDLDRAATSTGGGFDLAFSLVEAPGNAPLINSPGLSIVGQDPQLGPLANNGGTTATHLPSNTSPVIDRGDSGARLNLDQRGHERIVDGAVPNNPRGDGSDIGSVEVDHPAAPVDKRPSATIKVNNLGAQKRKTKPIVSGTATDDKKVAKVQVALVLHVHGRCRDLLKKGNFSKKTRKCSKSPSFLDAKGTKNWSFKLLQRLEPGSYVVFARAIDNKKQKQKGFSKKNRIEFKVK
jgi:hypothetical protein